MKRLLLVFLVAVCAYAQINRTTADLIQQGDALSIADAGANDSYTGCPLLSIAAYKAGMTIWLKPNTVNTGAATINVCGLGVKNIKKSDGTTDPADGQIPTGVYTALSYNGTSFTLPPQGGSGTPAGSSGNVQINSSGSFAGRALSEFTDNGTTLLHDPAYICGVSDDCTWAGKQRYTASSTQSITAAGNSILANARTVVVNPTSSLTLTSAPTIADGSGSDYLRICNASTSNTLTLQDQDTLTSSNLQLSSSTVGILPNLCLDLHFNGTDWVQVGTSGSSSPLTTKGDIYTRSSSADARLGVGSNDQVLKADSAQTTGVKWANPDTYVVKADCPASTSIGATTGTETTMATINLPTMATGSNYRVRIYSTHAAGTNATMDGTPVFQIIQGSTVLLSPAYGATADTGTFTDATVFITGSSTQQAMGFQVRNAGSNANPAFGSAGAESNTTPTLVIKARGGGSVTDDVVTLACYDVTVTGAK